jgi:hypothetical protein
MMLTGKNNQQMTIVGKDVVGSQNHVNIIFYLLLVFRTMFFQ